MSKAGSAAKVKLSSYDDLFGNAEEKTGSEEQIIRAKLTDLHEFRNHPFRVLDDEKMEETTESISKYGVLVPGIARPRAEGGYEIIAGHRRKRGSERAGKEDMPVIVRNYTDDEATIIMVDSNIQREDILPSEKAKAYAMKYEAMKHQGRKGNGKSILLKGAKGNNLKNVDVEFPLGKLICVTGVSGSGKSTLINETLQPILSQKFYRSLQDPLEYDSIEGLEYIDKVVDVDQSPLGRTPRSNPATYTGVFSDIRNLFVGLPEAKIRGYKPGRFSFNVAGGRCEACSGNGYKTIEMNFLPDVYVPCEVCHGKRYNRETLEVRFKGKSIADVLDMTINRAVEFFENVPQILNKIKVLQDVGLGYIKLGQSSTTLSGGESQRVKLATELSKRDTGKTLYILDEPTTGLHFEDIRVLMGVLNKLVDKGNTVIVIEHNLDVIKMADYIIDMGPEGGKGGGELLSCGTPEEVAKSSKGYTPRFLREELRL